MKPALSTWTHWAETLQCQNNRTHVGVDNLPGGLFKSPDQLLVSITTLVLCNEPLLL